MRRLVCLACLVTIGAPASAGAQAPPEPPPCAPSQVTQPPGLRLADVPRRMAFDRTRVLRVRTVRAPGAPVAYLPQFPTRVEISAGARDPRPFSATVAGEVRRERFPFKPERRRGARYRVLLSFVQGTSAPGSVCRRTVVKPVQGVAGRRPHVLVTSLGGDIYFRVFGRGPGCAETLPGPVGITVFGPDGRRSIALRDTCGAWTRLGPRDASGWVLEPIEGYFPGSDGTAGVPLPPTAAIAEVRFIRTEKPRRFAFRTSFARRLLTRGHLIVRPRATVLVRR